MSALIPWQLSPLRALLALSLLYLLARVLLADVHRVVSEQQTTARGVLTTGLWLFCLAGVLVLGAPPPALTRALSLLMLAMMFRLSVCDALTGLLVRRETLLFLVTGLTASGIQHTPRLADTLLAAALCFGLHRRVNRPQEKLGRGDLFLLTGLVAWSGPLATLQSAGLGVTGFILWHSTWRAGGRIEGPLGPWLCAAATCQQLHVLYQPLLVTP